MNVLGTPEISDYQGRTVTIEVTGVCEQAVNKTAGYTVRVPYSQMSQTIQRINRQGSKVASVSLQGKSAAQAVSSTPDEANVDSKTAENQEGDKSAAKSSRKKGRKRR